MTQQILHNFSVDGIPVRPAPENELLYDSFAPDADTDDHALFESIRQNGVLEPIKISADGFILSGHRRHAAARMLGLKSFPCTVIEDLRFGDLPKDERLQMLALYNKQRDKSNAECLREAMLQINADDAYEQLILDRRQRKQQIEDNVRLGGRKQRKRIVGGREFLAAAIRAIESERDFWPLTVRRVHYLLLNDPPLRHDKKPGSIYQNNDKCYNALADLLVRARLSGDIPHEAIDDETRPISIVSTYQNPADYIKYEAENFLRFYYRDLLRGQQNHIEILVEKNAIRTHIEVVASYYCIPCTTGRGYASLTLRLKMVQRFRESGKPHLILLILSDWDPDGEEIASSFARSLRDDFGLTDVTAHKVGISADDVREYNLPCMKGKAKKKSTNYKKFLRRFGTDDVAELDAAPVSLLQGKLRDAIESCLDMDLFQAEQRQEREDAAFVAAQKHIMLQAIK